MLQAAVSGAFAAAECVLARSVREAHLAIEAHAFDLALIDLALGDGHGRELIGRLALAQPGCTVVVATVLDDDDNLFAALQAGAQGYLLKDQGISWLSRQLSGIAQGVPPLSPAIARRILSRFHGRSQLSSSAAQDPLTAREREVLGLLAQGLQTADIANALGLSRHTVGDHVKSIYRKLNISSRAEAALRARGLGLA